jgi:hypothetical protein
MNDFKVLDSVRIQVISRDIVLEETEHIVNQDGKGLFVIKRDFKLYLDEIAKSNKIFKI